MPGRIVCFVCGNPGAETSIHVRQQETGPYFPFLEHHDPPKGSRQPALDGSIDCCRVCYAFLTTQWELYERSKTPAIKRLYWLKRADNGNFTGAEMRLQGEYIAQVMGLQYQPGCFDLDSALSPENSTLDSSYHSRQPANSSQHFSHQSTADKMETLSTKPFIDSALDLSTPKKEMEHVKNSSVAESNKMSDPTNFICYTCGQQNAISYGCYIDVLQQNSNEPFFPILENIKPYPGSDRITRSGQVRACGHCKNILFQQWQAYEMSGTPVSLRTYKIPTKLFKGSQSESKNVCKKTDNRDDRNECFVCYICGVSNRVENAGLLNTLPAKSPSSVVMFFPFIRELERPPGAEPLRPDGSVFACAKCYGSLSYQWQVQEMDGVPLYHRNYSLHFLSVKQTSQEADKSSKSSDAEPVKPLNIEISMASPVQKNQDPVSSVFPTTQGLLAIAPVLDSMNSRPIPCESGESLSNSPLKFHDALLNCKTSVSDSGIGAGSMKTVPHPLQQVSVMPKKVCYLCGERCLINKMHYLSSYPVRHEAKHTSAQAEPFFPFLANCEPAPKADPVTEEGCVIACNICYHTLMKQWSEFEQSNNPADSNRWLRKYTMPNHSCYVCAAVCERKLLRSLATEKFHFLKEHNAPADALVMNDGYRVAVCKPCAYSLMQQYAEFERMGLPSELRKYNWIQKAPVMYDSAPEDESQVCIDNKFKRYISMVSCPFCKVE